MNSPIQDMLKSYECSSPGEYRHALKEITQEVSLLGLSRGGFFRKAAFYGGTALRIFHGLKRFSEDMDFSLLEKDPDFELTPYLITLKDELGAYGFEMTVEVKEKKNPSPVKSAFIKGGTLLHLIKIASVSPPVPGVSRNELLRIKLEIDCDPPAGAEYETKYQLTPIPNAVRLYDKPSLFAGKVHALLCRSWKSRVKGRDFYDYLWYLSNGTELNIEHLRQRMIQSGHWPEEENMNREKLIDTLSQRFSSIDFRQAAGDVKPFLKNPDELALWSRKFFDSVSRDKLLVKK